MFLDHDYDNHLYDTCFNVFKDLEFQWESSLVLYGSNLYLLCKNTIFNNHTANAHTPLGLNNSFCQVQWMMGSIDHVVLDCIAKRNHFVFYIQNL